MTNHKEISPYIHRTLSMCIVEEVFFNCNIHDGIIYLKKKLLHKYATGFVAFKIFFPEEHVMHKSNCQFMHGIMNICNGNQLSIFTYTPPHYCTTEE
mmetsp:Transcript_14326/g.31364  ORF Transcript_14326/g.31364 Transcript_14326/m.31364 type:complete len:97 (-) Transcript_14326:1347-1637(-)